MQAQTRVLMRALQRLRVPTVLFVNKIDRGGAGYERVLEAVSERLTPAVIPMGVTRQLGTRDAGFTPWDDDDAAFAATLASVLAERDEELFAAYVDDDTTLSYHRLREELAAQTGKALVHPVFFGSAITGAGVDALRSGIAELLPARVGDADGLVSGSVFKIERGPAGEKVAYVRMFSGTVRTRERLRFGRDAEEKVTAIRVFEDGAAVQRTSVSGGEIGKLWGLGEIRIGDAIGTARTDVEHRFAPPTLETVVVPHCADEKGALHAALTQLAEQDPLIDLRQDDGRQELFVSLYGEVQKEIIQATLASEYGLHVAFHESTTICVERPLGTGAAAELAGKGNPFVATVGLRIDPARAGSGVRYRVEVEIGSMPAGYHNAVEAAVRETLRQGLRGWQVTDCAVALTHSAYPPGSTTADTRNLTPLVLMRALKQAGTVVCEPIHRFQLDFPADTLGSILPALARLEAVPATSAMRGASCTLEGEIRVARVHELQQQLRGLTRGEGVLETAFERYDPVRGSPPKRRRTDRNPLNRADYLLRLSRAV